MLRLLRLLTFQNPERSLAALMHFFLFQSTAFAIDEAQYAEEYERVVVPFWEQGEFGTLKVNAKVEIAYRIFSAAQPKGHLIVLQGWSEPMRKYAEVAYDLSQAGLSVYLFDWRGQGRSSRMLDDREKSYIADYKDYAADLDAFVSQVVRRKTSAPLIALAHSMGANILSIYSSNHPEVFDRIVLASPMLDIKTGLLPEWTAWAIARSAERLGFGESYVFGHGPYDGKEINIVTSSEIRRSVWLKHKLRHMEEVVSGATFSWLRASLEATWFMKENAHALKLPILMLQAGNDLYVETEGQNIVCQRAPNCRKVVFPEAKHEILNEVDSIRRQAFQEILQFSLAPR